MDLMCPIILSNNQKKKYEHDKKAFSDNVKYLKNFETVVEYFQVCQ